MINASVNLHNVTSECHRKHPRISILRIRMGSRYNKLMPILRSNRNNKNRKKVYM